MVEPAELLLIKDQYEWASRCLSRGLAAEEEGERAEALVYYRKGQQHLRQGLEVPTNGERQHGAVWDRSRQLQQRMRMTLKTVSTHLSAMETSQLTPESQSNLMLMDLPPNLYPVLPANSLPPRLPPRSPLHHLHPTIPTSTQNTAPTTNTAPVRPASPAALNTQAPPAAAPETIAMANPGDQPPAYTPQPTDGHRSLGYGPAGVGFRSGKQPGAAAGENGNGLLFIPSGVQMFFVTPNGQVSSLSSPGYLRIIAFGFQHKDSPAGRPPAFLDVSKEHVIISVCLVWVC